MNDREHELELYGCRLEDLKHSVEESLPVMGSYGMVALSMLSDAQEELGHGSIRRAIQTINRAQFVIGAYLMTRGEQGRGLDLFRRQS